MTSYSMFESWPRRLLRVSSVLLCYVMLCYVMLCYVMLCHVMLCTLQFMFCSVIHEASTEARASTGLVLGYN